VDHSMTWRMATIFDLLEKLMPSQAEKTLNVFIKGLQDRTWTIRPEWNLSPAPSVKQVVPTVTDHLIGGLESGEIQSVAGVEAVVGGNEVRLLDGTHLDIDTIIWCTGYTTFYGLLDKNVDPTTHTTPAWAAAPGSSGKALPRLFRNIFSLEYPDSLAFMGMYTFTSPAFQVYDLGSMAIAQVWKGASVLPPQPDMVRAVDEHHEWACELAQNGSVYAGIVKGSEWLKWANEVAGTGINEHLGYNWSGWMYWLRNMRRCNQIMSGTYSPHTFRLFDGKRKSWEGAWDAIVDTHEAIRKQKLKDA
jgi:dimethylaniline monooxygenase (N-oxide forming)